MIYNMCESEHKIAYVEGVMTNLQSAFADF